MNEPDQIVFTKEELDRHAKIYLISIYGHPKTGQLTQEQEDKWMERYGLLLAFIDDAFLKAAEVTNKP